jgi:hypothetical protein
MTSSWKIGDIPLIGNLVKSVRSKGEELERQRGISEEAKRRALQRYQEQLDNDPLYRAQNAPARANTTGLRQLGILQRLERDLSGNAPAGDFSIGRNGAIYHSSAQGQAPVMIMTPEAGKRFLASSGLRPGSTSGDINKALRSPKGYDAFSQATANRGMSEEQMNQALAKTFKMKTHGKSLSRILMGVDPEKNFQSIVDKMRTDPETIAMAKGMLDPQSKYHDPQYRMNYIGGSTGEQGGVDAQWKKHLNMVAKNRALSRVRELMPTFGKTLKKEDSATRSADQATSSSAFAQKVQTAGAAAGAGQRSYTKGNKPSVLESLGDMMSAPGAYKSYKPGVIKNTNAPTRAQKVEHAKGPSIDDLERRSTKRTQSKYHQSMGPTPSTTRDVAVPNLSPKRKSDDLEYKMAPSYDVNIPGAK